MCLTGYTMEGVEFQVYELPRNVQQLMNTAATQWHTHYGDKLTTNCGNPAGVRWAV